MKLFQKESGNLVGIDISSNAIKVAEVSGGRSGLGLKSIAIVPMPAGALTENTIVDAAAVTHTLKQAFKIARPSTNNVCFGMSGNAVIMKTLILPAMSEFELEAQIAFEAEHLFPFNIDEVYLDFQILGDVPHDPGSIEVIIVVCKRNIIDDYLLVFSDAGLKVKCIDCCSFSIANAFEQISPHLAVSGAEGLSDTAGGAVAMINIGAALININILDDGRSAFVRDQFYGGDQLTAAIMREHGLSVHAAEQIKQDNFHSIRKDVLEDFYLHLTSELVRSLDYYAAKHVENPVGVIYVTGGCALIPGIEAELEQRLGIRARVLNPLTCIKIPKRKFDPSYIDQTGPRMMVSLGLAMRSTAV